MKLNQATRQLATCIVLSVLALGCASSALGQERYKVSPDGQEVQDSKTGLTWRRCAEGMSWNGKACAGKPAKFSYVNAQKYVAAQASTRWRLPTKDEMLSLVDKTKKKPAIDGNAFPNTPPTLFWATRPESTDNLNAWIVDFSRGHVFGNNGTKAPHLRLVRASAS